MHLEGHHASIMTAINPMVCTRRITRVVRIRATVALALLFASANVLTSIVAQLFDSKLLLQSSNTSGKQYNART